jgi:retron-type reverse transcriptase
MIKLSAAFNQWTLKGKLPAYFTTARAIALSKEPSPFPSVGAIRTIAITPAVAKVYEKLVQARLQSFLESANILAPSQRGFRKGKSTLHNINELLKLRESIHKRKAEEITKRFAIDRRKVHSLLFLDFQKAFDRVNKLIQKHRVPPELLNAVLAIISNTKMTIDGESAPTLTGVPQGVVISPTLFNVYVNDLLMELHFFNFRVLAYADDIVIYCDGID